VDEIATRLTKVFTIETQYNFEVIVVENGSIDSTWDKLKHIASEDSRFRIIKLSRNFRMEGGLTAGMDCVTGMHVS
jgi:dolichol-phosphate mannosyltransferase